MPSWKKKKYSLETENSEDSDADSENSDENDAQDKVPSQISFFLNCFLFIGVTMTYPIILALWQFEKTFFTKIPFLYVLLFISINLSYSVILGIMYLVTVKFIHAKRKDVKASFEHFFGQKRLIGLMIFKVLPFCELLLAFLGEFIAR